MEVAPVGCKRSLISAMFLVGGTAIGGGMLALPVATGPSGFFPSLVMMLACWAAMTLSALLLLEVSLWMEEGAHVITMSSRILGRPGKAAAWLLYLFISYASIIAYTAGAGSQLVSAVEAINGVVIAKPIACTLFVLVFGAFLYLGTTILGRINAVLFVAMIVAYLGLIGLGAGHVKTDLLLHRNWSPVWLSVPFLLTSFSFQTMVPSLTPYLNRHANHLRWAIIGGTTISLVVYILWQWLVLGVMPLEGPHGLLAAYQKGDPATQYLKHQVGHPILSLIAEYFAFFAIVTSFLGMALGLFDFLADGLKVSRVGMGRVFLLLLIGIPTLFFASYYERAFIVALDSSGGYGDSILNGLMPALMVWVGRYHLGMAGAFRVGGGKILLGGVMAFFAMTLLVEIGIHSGLLESYLGLDISEHLLDYHAEIGVE